ncbi:PAS domain-containing sensor histidine kinase [Asticcacaulis tiandongensis]|uniref:sensor histidine kinase n=1 Tax=Asticcacaulis tiandongensis TaxID=2565365 RepID=UPI001127B8DC|nr:PAS domain-containing sensor histidine kinase [Asticcacaulis tiandongensis]
MTVTTIAFAAAAGAMALALSTTVLSWRVRSKLIGERDTLKSELSGGQTVLGELDAATSAFDEAFVAVEDNLVRLVWGDETLQTCAQALGLKSDTVTAPQVIEAIGNTSPEAAAALTALITQGKSCHFEVFAEAGSAINALRPSGITLLVEGRVSGATAWIRLAIAGARKSLSSGPFAQMANLLPYPCWVATRGPTEGSNQMIWANAAWLKAVDAQSLEQAQDDHLGLDRSADILVSEALAQNMRREGFRWLTIDGQRRAFQVIVEPLTEGHVAAYAIDVTEGEESREALRRHAKAHDETLDRLEDAVAIFGPEKRLTFHNRAFETLWGLDTPWLAERPTHGEILERLRQKRKLPETSDFSKWKAQELDFYGLTDTAPDEIWSLPNGRALRVVRQPHPLGGLLLLYSDKTGELALKSQFNSLIQVQRATLDQLTDAVSVFGSDGRLRLRNKAFDDFWHLNSDEITPDAEFSHLSGMCLPLVHDRGFWSELKARITDTDPVARAPQTGEVKTSDDRLAQWRTQPLPDGATLVAFADITSRRALEQAIEARDTALTDSVRLKREFVGNVSYELRTPLTTIVGYAEMLQRQADALDDRNRDYLDSIQSAATALARSIDDVLDMAQIDAGEMDVSLTEVNLAQLVARSRTHREAALTAKAIRFTYEGLDTRARVKVDARRLTQVIEHLLDYALINTQTEGQIFIRSRKDADTLALEIGYTGRGIPYHTQAHIFDRYVGRERGGPGLGLALVKALVELHDGWITLESDPQTGATFTLHLPHQTGTGMDADMPVLTPEPVAVIAKPRPQSVPEAKPQEPAPKPTPEPAPVPAQSKPEQNPQSNPLGLNAETLAEARRILGML